MFNGVVPPPTCEPASVVAGQTVGCFNDTAHQCGYAPNGPIATNNSWHFAAATCAAAGFSMAGAEDGLGAGVWCGNAMPTAACPKIADTNCNAQCPGNKSETCGGAGALQVVPFTCAHVPTPTETAVVIEWAPYDVGTHTPLALFEPINASYLSPSFPPAEQKREDLQRGLAQGWGPWKHFSILALVKLPEAATFTTLICETGSSNRRV